MDIAALSSANSLNKIQSAVSMEMLKKTMDSAQTSNANLLSMMVPSSPTLGNNVDISA